MDLSAGDQRRDFTYVADVARGLLLLGLAEAASDGVVNLATGSQISVRSFVESAIDVLGMQAGQARFGAIPERGGEVRQGPLEIGLLRELVGWRPETTVPEGIRRTDEFHRAAEVTTSEA